MLRTYKCDNLSRSVLRREIEEIFETGKAPYPVKRIVLVSGVLESCLTSRLEGQKRLETPHLDLRYCAHRVSQHSTV
jgi:hypothetical protein